MSGDSQDESLGGASEAGGPRGTDGTLGAQGTGGARGAESAGLASRQVPSQGGRGRSARKPGLSARGDGGGGGQDEHTVPAQREGAGVGSVLPPPRELPFSDAELVQRMREGDDSAYEELFRRHSDAVRRYARTCCRDAHTADDLTAEVFARTLQAVRGGAGPEHAVRAYLLTTVRRVAAAWAKCQKREQLVDDFAVFAAEAARGAGADAASEGTLDLGADVRAMHEAEQSLAMQAFRSLPERWQAVLWHTTVEEESPSEVAPLFGLTANATAVLASRAREGLKQAYLQAHVSSALTSGGDCARYADRLGAYARGGLRMRAERGLRAHLEECAKCRLAAGELAHVNAGIPALLPVAVIGWFAAGYSLKAAGIVAGGAVGAGAAGAGAAGAGADATAGGASGSASGGGGTAGGAAASEGLGAPAKAAIAATLAVAAAAGLVWAMANDPESAPKAEAKPPLADSVLPQNPAPSQKPASRPESQPKSQPKAPAPSAPEPAPDPTTTPQQQEPSPKPTPSPAPPPKPAPEPKPTPPPGEPAPPVPPAPQPTPRPTPPPPPPAPKVYQVNRLSYGLFGDHTGPEVRLAESSWIWQRWGMSIDGKRYRHGVTVRAQSSVVIDLNRPCSAYDAWVGVDDLTLGLGAMRFSVYGDGARLWQSPVLRGGDPAVPVHVPLAGRKTIRLVAEPQKPRDSLALGDWAQSQISCG
ncbi:sigma-70 family RNA polymerase sigma factor [Streptomyces sp. NPDC051907]|uniref:sigma-70 family RNA polymerase sigma factor n=1 Tax=Streptomyces sp. NPDC051907 TaxID=3155284 RepID=UPI00343249A1